MKSNLESLLEEFLPEETVASIITRAKEMELIMKVRKPKGRWHRETLNKLIKERGDYCNSCNASGKKIKLTLDHIVPKALLLDMGLDEYYEDEENLNILCSKCNGLKGSALDFSNNKTVSLLEKYIKIYKEKRGLS